MTSDEQPGWLKILARWQIELALISAYPILSARRARTIAEEALRRASEPD